MPDPVRSPKTPLSYDEQCLIWRRGLGEVELRSLASDYLRGDRSADAIDAFKEYEDRWGKYVKGETKMNKIPKKRRSSRYR